MNLFKEMGSILTSNRYRFRCLASNKAPRPSLVFPLGKAKLGRGASKENKTTRSAPTARQGAVHLPGRRPRARPPAQPLIYAIYKSTLNDIVVTQPMYLRHTHIRIHQGGPLILPGRSFILPGRAVILPARAVILPGRPIYLHQSYNGAWRINL